MSPDLASPGVALGTRTSPLAFGPFVYDPKRRLLRREGVEIPLPPRVLGVLELLLTRADEVVPRQELIDTVWKEAFVTDTSLAEAVSYLRQALGDDSQAPAYIQTVHRRGYRFVARVSDLAPPAAGEAVAAAETRAVSGGGREAAAEPVRPSIANELLPWSVAIMSFVAALSALWYATNERPLVRPMVKIAIALDRDAQFDTRAPAIALSGDGSRLAWSACVADACRLYLRELGSLNEVPVPQTEGAAAPFFSPDHMWLGFFADGKLKKVFLGGGTPSTVADASQPFGAVWMPDGRIVFAASVAGGLSRVSDRGGDVETLTRPSAANGEIRHEYPSRAADGKGILFTVVTSPTEGSPGRLALLPYGGSRAASSWRTLADGALVGRAVGREYVAFMRDADVHAIAFDPVRQAASGVEHLVESAVTPPHMAVSDNGALVVSGLTHRELKDPPPAWSWSTSPTRAIESITIERAAALSPDGSQVAGLDREARSDVWMLDVNRGTSVRMTFSAPNAAPVFGADGLSLFYASRRNGSFEIWSRGIDGSPERRILARADRHLFPASASAELLAFVETGGDTRSDIGIVRLDDPQSAARVVQTPFDETAPALSPDGRLLAYQSDESGRWEVTVLRLADGRRLAISKDTGTRPLWSPEGRVLYFHSATSLMAVPFTSAGELAGSASVVLPRLNRAIGVGVRPDGAVLLHRADTGHDRADFAVLTLEWIQKLRREVAPPVPSVR